MTITHKLSLQFQLSQKHTAIYMEVVEKLLDNLMQMGIPVDLPGLLKVDYDYSMMKAKIIGFNKNALRSTMRGKNNTYLCGNWGVRKVYKPKKNQYEAQGP